MDVEKYSFVLKVGMRGLVLSKSEMSKSISWMGRMFLSLFIVLVIERSEKSVLLGGSV